MERRMLMMKNKDDSAGGGQSRRLAYLYEQQESFSFNYLDFNSSHGFLTDDDDDDDEDDDGGYIEISLDPQTNIHEGGDQQICSSTSSSDDCSTNATTTTTTTTTTPREDSPSSAALVSPCPPGVGDMNSSSTVTGTSTTSSYEVVSSGGGTSMKRSNGGRRVPFPIPAVNHLVKVLQSNHNGSSRSNSNNNNSNNVEGPPISSSSTTILDANSNGSTQAKWKLLRTRERRWKVTSAGSTTSSSGGGVANKLLVKLRSNSIWLMLSSSLSKLKSRSSRVSISPPPPPTCPGPGREFTTTSNTLGSVGNGEKSAFTSTSKSLFLEIKLDAISRVLEAMTRNITIAARRPVKLQTKSCPGSIKSSPVVVHQLGTGDTHHLHHRAKINYARDNSVQAAIAHCKKSFGKPPNDFSF